MFSIYNILTIAKFETKTLFRSWFFRVFAILTLGVLGFMNILFFTDAIEILPWSYRAIPGAIPYLNMMFYNIAQAIIAIFMASDFLKRDYKLNTTEVIYMRSMTNGDYVLGKLIGILFVFISLNLLIYLFALVVNVVFADVPVYFSPYVLYFLVMGIPSLVFIIGLSFFGMIVVRNQALTFILILGYVAISIFFLTSKVNYLFDYMSWYIPLAYSDFVGFSDLGPVVVQRLLYLFLGLAFIFITIFSIRRLPQSPVLSKASVFIAGAFFILGLYFGFIHYRGYNNFKSSRSQMIALNDELSDSPLISVVSDQLSVKHRGDIIQVSAEMGLRNDNKGEMTKIIFSLNPGLKVQSLKIDGQNARFERKLHIISIDKNLAAGQTASLIINYSGTISQSGSYLDVEDEQFELINNIGPLKVQKQFGFVTPGYLLLTRENLWYPEPGTTFGSKISPKWKTDFIDFSLEVETRSDLTALSQGRVEKVKEGNFVFRPEHPLPQISLIVGEYQKRAITVDSVEYALYTHPEHRYFLPYVSEIADTLGSLINDVREQFEDEINLTYSFPRLALVEVPIQYFAFDRRLSSVTERIQPEQMLVPENGASLYSTDFKRTMRMYERHNRNMSREVSQKQVQTSLFNRFLNEVQGRGFRGRHGGGEIKFPVRLNLIPQYYQFVTHFNAREYPLLSTAFESFLNTLFGDEESPFVRFFRGITNEEKANLLLRDKSFAELLNDTEHFDQIKYVLKVKSDFLFKRLIGEVGDEEFTNYFYPVLEENKFRAVEMSQFLEELKSRFGIEFESWLEPWLNDVSLPGLFVSNIKAYQVLDGNMTRYQVRFTLANDKEVDGLVSVEFRSGGRRGGGRRFGPPPVAEKRIITIEPKQAKEVFILLDDEPRSMTINTIMAENLPLTFMQRLQDIELDKNAVPFDGEKVLDQVPPFTLPGEYIVDNEDKGFRFETGRQKSVVQKLLNLQDSDEEEYIPFRFYRPPSTWRKTTFDGFYGKYVHSASFIRSGDGSKTATWSVNLESSGQYDIFAYNPRIKMRFGDRGRGGERNYVGELHFKVYHDDGVEEILLDAPNADEGWNLLGSYYLSAGDNKVEISNKSNQRLVIADAIKWVKKLD